jgi:DNA/RNA-binding domain of Phe-tRNA-synthetase-like protein
LNLEGLPLFADARGAHGSATSDSERTMVTATTKLVLAVIISFGSAESFRKWPETTCSLLERHARARHANFVVVG